MRTIRSSGVGNGLLSETPGVGNLNIANLRGCDRGVGGGGGGGHGYKSKLNHASSVHFICRRN